MGTTQTAEEVKQEHLEKLGPELGNIYHQLRNELIFIHIKWCEFEELYAHEERVELMKKNSPNFFYYLQNILFEDVILAITRITESKTNKGKENLTIRHFPSLVSDKLKGKTGKLIKRINSESSFCRDRRNRKIGHLDKNLALKENPKPLEIASRNKVNQVLDSLAELMNFLQLEYMNSSTHYRVRSDHGYFLLQRAERGRKLRDLRLKLIKENKIDLYNELYEYLNEKNEE
ncbi:hypothetical protein SAMN05421640_2374 [Ekhidna lutea]|uniref:HEPN AbiU2-like domain-containing protein n=1 Tax=Ekhidna lutea TaxID=447679 RepID=A0A239K393_EKHLU|nr:hypothetical protein [Ekhidna lutea]SNT12189.1 hypothetical protein SAMN05421640_2374 [Ekhidna lutea]